MNKIVIAVLRFTQIIKLTIKTQKYGRKYWFKPENDQSEQKCFK